jgi:nanoRNase/pAp phosphatase (c-di-AMP/oligoRNAs hydrolase)
MVFLRRSRRTLDRFNIPRQARIPLKLQENSSNEGQVLHEFVMKFINHIRLSRVRLLRRVYNQFKLTDENRIAYLWLKKSDYSKSGATREDTEGLIDHIRAIEPVVVACLFEEIEPGETRISLRSKHPDVNVNEIANLFGGGGHKAASGARIEGSQLSVQRKVISAIRKALKTLPPEE